MTTPPTPQQPLQDCPNGHAFQPTKHLPGFEVCANCGTIRKVYTQPELQRGYPPRPEKHYRGE